MQKVAILSFFVRRNQPLCDVQICRTISSLLASRVGRAWRNGLDVLVYAISPFYLWRFFMLEWLFNNWRNRLIYWIQRMA